VKVFGMRKLSPRLQRSLAEAPSEAHLLDEHEVEVRYLELLSHMMRGGLLDCVTMVLGFCLVTREELVGLGYVSGGETALFPEGKYGTGKYVVIFAESADCSLTALVHQKATAAALPLATSADVESLRYTVHAAVFQIMFAIATIHRVFPSFRHNDMHASNILIQYIDVEAIAAHLKLLPDEPIVVEYAMDDLRWQVDLRRAPFRVLVWDLNYASINAADANMNGLTHVLPRCREYGALVPLSKVAPNQYCDIHKCLDTLTWVLSLEKYGGALEKLFQQTKRLLAYVVPQGRSCREDLCKTKLDRKAKQQWVHSEPLHTNPTEILMEQNFFQDMEVSAHQHRARPVYRLRADGLTHDSETRLPPTLFSYRDK